MSDFKVFSDAAWFDPMNQRDELAAAIERVRALADSDLLVTPQELRAAIDNGAA